MLKLLLVAGCLAAATPAWAQSVLETDFIVTQTDASGAEVSESTNVVKLRNGACYNWWLRLSKTKGDVTVTEIFTVPSPPANWGVSENSVISEDQLSSTAEYVLTPDAEGWIGKGWCAAKGDPLGDHLIEVKIGDRLVGTFPFVVE